MARKRKFDYFSAFMDMSNYAVKYADKLVGFLEEHYDEETKSGAIKSSEVLEKLTELHEIEESSDKITHTIEENLVTEFVAPIDREDVMKLADELDTVVDELDDVLQRMYMYNVTTITSEIIDMARVVHKATVALQSACDGFTNLKKSKSIKKYIVEINDCEDEGDQIYIKSVHNIYKRTEEGAFDHPLVAVGLVGVLSSLEKCCDACESVGDSIVMVRLKNS
jgi:predicted phosphate transport protein (TIGR00153 family)